MNAGAISLRRGQHRSRDRAAVLGAVGRLARVRGQAVTLSATPATLALSRGPDVGVGAYSSSSGSTMSSCDGARVRAVNVPAVVTSNWR